jgi:hypothetical protein
MSASAQEIVELAQEELGLVVAGRFTELADVHARRDRAIAALPPGGPDDETRPLLEYALALQTQVGAMLDRAQGETTAELLRLARGRRAASGYAATTSHAAPLKRR